MQFRSSCFKAVKFITSHFVRLLQTEMKIFTLFLSCLNLQTSNLCWKRSLVLYNENKELITIEDLWRFDKLFLYCFLAVVYCLNYLIFLYFFLIVSYFLVILFTLWSCVQQSGCLCFYKCSTTNKLIDWLKTHVPQSLRIVTLVLS